MGLAKYNPKRFFIVTLTGKLVLSYSIVFISHLVLRTFQEPYLEDITDVTMVYVGIIIFGVMMTVVVILLLRLNWEKFF